MMPCRRCPMKATFYSDRQSGPWTRLAIELLVMAIVIAAAVGVVMVRYFLGYITAKDFYAAERLVDLLGVLILLAIVAKGVGFSRGER
jgi:undecaprenyl pyrophosphate phosphatase UppP